MAKARKLAFPVLNNAAMVAAQAAFDDSGSIADLDALEAAEAAYNAALSKAEAEWAAHPVSGEARDNAELNASETEGTEGDRLVWTLAAILSVY